MVFKINLATKIYINSRLLTICTVSAVLICVFLVFLNITNISAKAGEMKSLSNRLAVMDDKLKTVSKVVSEKDYSAILAKIDFANAIIDKKMYNWLTLLNRLEMVVPEGIAISSIDPETKSQTLRLSGVGRSFKSLRIFMENLENSQYFAEVYLTSHGNVKLSDNTQGMTFSLTCRVTNK